MTNNANYQHLLEIIPAIRARLSHSGISPVIHFEGSPEIKISGKSKQDFEKNLNGIDGIYLEGAGPGEILNSFYRQKQDKNFTNGLVMVSDLGLLGIGASWEEAGHLINILLKGAIVSGQEELPGNRRMENKICIVTGGAMGFGKGIAEEIAGEGGYVVVADLNDKVGIQTVDAINAREGSKKAAFIHCDVMDPESVRQMVLETVLEFGGLDVLISNAGVLKAGSLEELDEKTFDFITGVNYRGFFICTKYCTPVMKNQYRHNTSMFMDVIQINSKSGLSGSNKNFAYAGSKFGSIGLVQSFAKELAPFHIKVNAVCPGNYFEGPLWSDPENGLFAQYLKAGKVPGAKTVEDVKRHYESLVPLGRGCTPKDIVKTIYYLVDQEYETGQAIPVTGGQVMLN